MIKKQMMVEKENNSEINTENFASDSKAYAARRFRGAADIVLITMQWAGLKTTHGPLAA
jgi:hypothetical protein